MILPAWTNRQPDWRAEVWPTLRLAGALALTNASFDGIGADWVRSDFTCTNQLWHLPNLEWRRADGEFKANCQVDERTKRFEAHLESTLDPGLGSSRVTSGSAQYVITNGVVFSDDLEWRAAAMRLQYVGGVDLEGRVNATVQAELLRDTWLVGRIVSLALWPVSKMLEFKVTGTLNQPKAEPLYIPKVLTAPLHPFRALKELFGENPEGTNAPPKQSRP